MDTRTAQDVVAELRATLGGVVVTAEDSAYEDARRVFYRSFDRRPAAVVKPTDAREVSQVVSLARVAGAELAVRSGGHSLAGHGVSEGGIVLDLSELQMLDLDLPVVRRSGGVRRLTAAGLEGAINLPVLSEQLYQSARWLRVFAVRRVDVPRVELLDQLVRVGRRA